MSIETPVIERAFQIARGIVCATANDVRKALARQGISAVDLMHITPSVAIQIKKLCTEARAKALAVDEITSD